MAVASPIVQPFYPLTVEEILTPVLLIEEKTVIFLKMYLSFR